MGSRTVPLVSIVTLTAAVVGVMSTADADTAPTTKITVWGTGGDGYGATTFGALISERRKLEIPASGEVSFTGVANTLDPASAHLRDLTEPSLTIVEQRFIESATTPTDILLRHVGKPIVVVTTKGEASGVLRSADDEEIVLEVGSGAQRRLHLMQRSGLLETRLPPGPVADRTALWWRVATKRPGTHDVELTYRTDGLVWQPEYLAMLGDNSGGSVELSARATIKNETGTSFDAAELTLVGQRSAQRASAAPRYVVPTRVHLETGQATQVDLIPIRRTANARSVVTYEAMSPPAADSEDSPGTDCSQFGGGTIEGKFEMALEIAGGSGTALPEGRVRVFRRKAERVELVGEGSLRSTATGMRIPIASGELGDTQLDGSRRALSCNYDERAGTVTEKIEIKLENNSKRALDVVIRDYAWRWPMYRVEHEDSTSSRDGQTLEYRISIRPGVKRKLSYTVVYLL